MKNYIKSHPYRSLIFASIGVWVLYAIVYNGLWATNIPFFSGLVVWYPFHFIPFFMLVHLITIIIISRIAQINWLKSLLTITSLFIGVPVIGIFLFWVLIHGAPRYFNLRGMDFDKTLWEEGFKGEPMTATRCEMANSTKKMLEEKKLTEEEVLEILGPYDGYWSRSQRIKSYVIGWCGVGIDIFEMQIFYDSNNVVEKVRIIHT